MTKQLAVDQAEKNARSRGQLDQFIGLPAKRCGVCGGCEFYLSESSPSPACVDCNPPTGGPVSRLYAVLDGSRLRYRAELPEPVKSPTDHAQRERERIATYAGTGRYWTHTATGYCLDKIFETPGELPAYLTLDCDPAEFGEESDGTVFEI